MAIADHGYLVRPGRTYAWADVINLLLGIWLFISPWVLQFNAVPGAGGGIGLGAGSGAAAWNAWVLGVVVFVIAALAMSAYARTTEWINVLLGIWIFIAPWVLGFAASGSAAAWDHWVVGALVFIFAATGLSGIRSRAVPATPTRPDMP